MISVSGELKVLVSIKDVDVKFSKSDPVPPSTTELLHLENRRANFIVSCWFKLLNLLESFKCEVLTMLT